MGERLNSVGGVGVDKLLKKGVNLIKSLRQWRAVAQSVNTTLCEILCDKFVALFLLVNI